MRGAVADAAARHIGAALLAVASLLPACGGGNTAPAIDTIDVEDHGPIFRRMQVALSEPGEVDVEYGASGNARLRVTSAVRSSRHALVLPRLRERETYTFRVRARAAIERDRRARARAVLQDALQVVAVAFRRARREHDLHDVLVERLRQMLVEHLESRGYTARTVTTKVRYPDFSIRSRSTSLPVGTDDGERISELACQMLERALDDRPGALRLVGVALSGLDAHRQLALV